MALFPLMYFLIILVFPTILPEGRALKRTEEEPNISADLKVDFKLPVCQTKRNDIEFIWMSSGSDQDGVLFLPFRFHIYTC
uniref:Exocrine gland-secreting peptide 20 n=1 Tax=Mus musculus TaxID=10090 RepID=A8R0V3_MOUSE|nr:exocrine gland-secreting peptide 20 [Mus musculus]